jgi:hypothetical protein
MKGYGGVEIYIFTTLNLGTRWKCVVNFMLLSAFSGERALVSTD